MHSHSRFFEFTFFFPILLILSSSFPLHAEEAVNLGTITRIRAEGFHSSQVMKTLQHLTDVIGPRLTNSPQMLEANEWTRAKLAEWGLVNAELEPWGEFGRGWSFSRSSVHMLSPRAIPIFALPKAWTPGTDGPVRGEAIRVDIGDEDDFEKYEGKLKGKVLLLSDEREPGSDTDGPFRRWADDKLNERSKFPIPGDGGPRDRSVGIKRWELREKVRGFYIDQGALATLEISSRDSGIIRVSGSRSYEVGQNPGPTGLYVAAEHYNQIARLLELDMTVEIEVDVEARFHEEETQSFNTVAEIPGTDLAHEVVMLGAHLDSWHAGTGATDNASGSAVAMEAVRILQSIGVKPRRTIRIALWSGEEQGLNGSRGYVKNHFASRPESDDPEQAKLPSFYREQTWPLTTTDEHANFSAYFNLDNGSGKIRGIYAQENSELRPIFQAWLAPFADLGAETVSLRGTGSTDHVPFDSVGLPGFQFIQDPLEYSTRTHHSHLDVFDRLQRDDMKQASVIMASFVYHAAMRDEKLPRKPMPEPPPKDEDEDEEEDGE